MTDSKPADSAAVAADWYEQELSETGSSDRGKRRSARARLRRAGKLVEVMQEPEALRLIEALSSEHREQRESADRVAILAGILAFVEEKDDRKFARAIGRAALSDETAIVSEIRFRRLLQTPGGELLDPMRRLIRLAGGKANVHDMAFSVLRWGDGVRKRWIFDYYGVSASASPRESAPPVPTAT